MTKHPLDRLDAEIRDHLDRETEENVARGMTPGDARRAALRRFGSIALAQERAREVWVPVWLDQLRQDVRYAVRVLARHPGFATVCALTLALGIGLTTAVFSVVHAVLIRPLPYADSERLVLVRETFRDQIGNASAGHFHDWTADSTVFAHTAAGQPATFNLADGGDPERVRGMRVTAGYFQVAYMPPAAGRYFTPDDLDRGARVAVLSHALWQSRFGGDRTIVGRDIRLGGVPFTVVGVAPASFALTDPARGGLAGGFSAQLWTLLAFTPEQRANYGAHYLGVMARLKPGVTVAQAQQDIERVTRGIAERHPKQMESRSVVLQPLKEELVGSVRPQLLILMGSAAAVLLIGCVNIAALLIARATTRRREMAIRGSLGGGRLRIVRQLLTESLVLAAAGGALALLVARLGIDFLVTSGPVSLPRLGEAALRPEVLAFALGLTAVSAIACGLAPAVRVARADLQSALRAGAAAPTGTGRDRLRTAMAVAETSLTVVLLVGTGLLLRSADRLRQVPLGFDADNVVTARIALPEGRYASDDSVAEAYRRMLDSLRSTPGVRQAAAASALPLLGGGTSAGTVAEGQVYTPGSMPDVAIRLVTDGYFEALGVRMIAGRSLQRGDMTPAAPPVVVVNERLAAVLWPGVDPIGKRLSTWVGPDGPVWREVAGVARDVRSFGQNAPVPLELFIPYTQPPAGAWTTFQRSLALIVASGQDRAENQMPAIRAAVKEVDPTVPIYEVRTMDDVVAAATATRRFYLQLVLVLAGAGLFLGMVGIYGVIAYFVTQRTGEIGLRLAIGADRRDVVGMVVAQALRVVLAGLLIGIPAALLLGRAMRALLFEITPADPTTFLGVAAILLLTSLAAALLPSVRAARVDPITALKHE